MADPKITKIEIVVYEHEIQDMGTDYNGFNTVYEKGSVLEMRPSILRIHTNTGVIGESDSGPAVRQCRAVSIGQKPVPSRGNLQ